MLRWDRKERRGIINLKELSLGQINQFQMFCYPAIVYRQKYKSANSKLLHVIEKMPENRGCGGEMALFHLHSFDVVPLQLNKLILLF